MKELVTFEKFLEQYGKLIYSNKGISMLPLLREGRDVMIIEKNSPHRLKKLDVVLFKRPTGNGRHDYVLHRILKLNEDGSYWVVGDNCISGDTVEKKDILGIMTAVIRNGKTIQMDNLGCKIYANTWCRCYHIRFFILRGKHFVKRCLRRFRSFYA